MAFMVHGANPELDVCHPLLSVLRASASLFRASDSKLSKDSKVLGFLPPTYGGWRPGV